MNKLTDEITYRSACPDDYRSIWILLCEIGWKKYISDYERYCRMISNSNRTVVALKDSFIVGFARALCDNASIGYITMVAVAQDKQHQGIGKKMVNMIMGDDPHIKWVLTTADDSTSFWEGLGFKPMKSAMIRQRAIDLVDKHPAEERLSDSTSCKDKFIKRIRKIYHSFLPSSITEK